MATLLCSLLIGSGYGAMVVSGYATREVVNNDQKRVDCPHIPTQIALDQQKPLNVSHNMFYKIFDKLRFSIK